MRKKKSSCWKTIHFCRWVSHPLVKKNRRVVLASFLLLIIGVGESDKLEKIMILLKVKYLKKKQLITKYTKFQHKLMYLLVFAHKCYFPGGNARESNANHFIGRFWQSSLFLLLFFQLLFSQVLLYSWTPMQVKDRLLLLLCLPHCDSLTVKSKSFSLIWFTVLQLYDQCCLSHYSILVLKFVCHILDVASNMWQKLLPLL